MTTESAVEDPRPLVTIAIPAYNEAKSLARCLASVLSNVDGSQPTAAVEILLLDDGSDGRHGSTCGIADRIPRSSHLPARTAVALPAGAHSWIRHAATSS